MNFLRPILFSLLPAMITFSAASTEPSDTDPFEMDLEQNINTPAVPQKRHALVKEQIDKLRLHFERAGFQTSRVRHGEVLKITIPCSNLFRANEFKLSKEGNALLKSLKLPDEAAGKYKLLITVHTDNTGEVTYADSITAARANAIDDFMNAYSTDSETITVPFGIGRDEPIGNNDSVKNRSKNRRVEIYIVPTEKLLEKSKK